MPEVRDRAIRMAEEHRGEYGSERAVISPIAAKIGWTVEMLRRWCREGASRRAGPAVLAGSDRDRADAQ